MRILATPTKSVFHFETPKLICIKYVVGTHLGNFLIFVSSFWTLMPAKGQRTIKRPISPEL